MPPSPRQYRLVHIITQKFFILAAFLVALTLILFLLISHYVTKEVNTKLFEELDHAVTRIENYVKERKRDVTALAQMPGIVDAITNLSNIYSRQGVDSATYHQADARLRPYLTAFKESADYYDLFLISNNGDVIFTVIHEPDFATNLSTGPYNESGLAVVFQAAKISTVAHISRLAFYEPSQNPAAFVAAPVFDKGEFQGVVALQINRATLLENVDDRTGLADSGEILALSTQQERIVFVNNTRHDPNASFERSVAINVEDPSPLHLAVKGYRGNSIYRDYRGRPVLAVWGFAPSMNWGLVVKIDKSEAFRPLHQLRNILLSMLLLVLLGILLLMRYVSENVTVPIERLTQIVSLAGHGNLHIHVESRLKSLRNEIGDLARAFDTMLGSLDQITASHNELDKLNKELTGQKDKLQQAYHHIQTANEQLIKSEKLASIGYMSAGIAHEINNPLTTILNNMHAMEEYFQSLTYLLTRYEQATSGTESSEEWPQRLLEVRQEYHIDYIIHDLPQMFRQTQTGLERIRHIIKDLLTFARGDEGTLREVRLPEVIESIWGIISGEIGDNIVVTKNFDADTPPVLANPHLLGQVFVNILLNCIHALEGLQGEIVIRTYGLGDRVFAVITDTGKGIAPEDLRKIWNPFYTDKPIGEGTGLGLSIAHSIIEQHHGEISVVSEVGQGTTITICLPRSSA